MFIFSFSCIPLHPPKPLPVSLTSLALQKQSCDKDHAWICSLQLCPELAALPSKSNSLPSFQPLPPFAGGLLPSVGLCLSSLCESAWNYASLYCGFLLGSLAPTLCSFRTWQICRSINQPCIWFLCLQFCHSSHMRSPTLLPGCWAPAAAPCLAKPKFLASDLSGKMQLKILSLPLKMSSFSHPCFHGSLLPFKGMCVLYLGFLAITAWPPIQGFLWVRHVGRVFHLKTEGGVREIRIIGEPKDLQEVWMAAKLFIPTQKEKCNYHGLTTQH